jgi:hypothetical protein
MAGRYPGGSYRGGGGYGRSIPLQGEIIPPTKRGDGSRWGGPRAAEPPRNPVKTSVPTGGYRPMIGGYDYPVPNSPLTPWGQALARSSAERAARQAAKGALMAGAKFALGMSPAGRLMNFADLAFGLLEMLQEAQPGGVTYDLQGWTPQGPVCASITGQPLQDKGFIGNGCNALRVWTAVPAGGSYSSTSTESVVFFDEVGPGTGSYRGLFTGRWRGTFTRLLKPDNKPLVVNLPGAALWPQAKPWPVPNGGMPGWNSDPLTNPQTMPTTWNPGGIPEPLPFPLIPARQDNPYRPPTERTETGPKPEPKPRPDVSPNPRPPVSPDPWQPGHSDPDIHPSNPALVIPFTPGGKGPPEVVTRTHYREPPKRGEKEQKLSLNKGALLLSRALNAATETKDFVDAFHDALPKKIQNNCKGKGLACRMENTIKNADKIDWSKALTNYVANHAEDKAIGALNRGANRMKRIGTGWGVGFGPGL